MTPDTVYPNSIAALRWMKKVKKTAESRRVNKRYPARVAD
jgi:hypothetical protein